MSELACDFSVLMEQVRSGSQEAAQTLFERFGAHVLLVVRTRLGPRLRSQYDSADFTQSVWASFFHTSANQYTFQTPEALVAFLSKTASNKVIEAARKKLGTRKHDLNHLRSLDEPLNENLPVLGEIIPGKMESPSQLAVADESWQKLLQDQPAHHRKILELLREGFTHEEIADAVNVNTKTIQRLIQFLERKIQKL